ncbi:MAG: hypothetical protein AB7G25_15565 [Sphingomonadaceae bacterium]
MLPIALMLIAAPAETPASAQILPVQGDICEIITHSALYDGKPVEFFGFRLPDIETLRITGPDCRDRYIMIGENVQGRWSHFLPEVREAKWFVPSGTFRGKLRVVRDRDLTQIFLDDGVIISSGLSEYRAAR